MRRRAAGALVALALALILAAVSSCGASGSPTTASPEETRAATNRKGGVGLKRIGSFDSPVYVTGAPGRPSLLFVVEQRGRIEVLRKGRRLGRPFLDISNLVAFEGERGLLSAAFPPDFAGTGLFYVYFVNRDGNIEVDEFHASSPSRADAGSRRPVIEIPHPVNSNHNGGQLQFQGDLLFLGTGDGGSAGDPPNNAQNKESLLGKLLRIDPRASGGRPYSVPPSNPFVGKPGRDEIYSYGLRNPFRFSFDYLSRPSAPRLVIGDVGQNRFEEVDFLPVAAASGANFGWDALEGRHPYEDENSGTADPGGTVKPVFQYSHDRGGCSITGGYVLTDRALRGLYRRYVYTDYCDGEIRSLAPHVGRAGGDRELGLQVNEPGSFGEDTRGHLYVTSLAGPVFRFVPR